MHTDLTTELCLASIDRKGATRAADGLRRLIAISRSMAMKHRSVLSDLFESASPVSAWAHRPDGDAHDPRAGFRWYYHAHPRATPGEHGHFHLFAQAGSRGVTHLVSLGVDAHGRPRSLFTANRWVTDEVWRPAAAVLRLIARFSLRAPRMFASTHRWLRAVLDAFAPQVQALLVHRDARLAHLAARQGRAVSEDRRIAILSRCRIDLDSQARALDHALFRRA